MEMSQEVIFTQEFWAMIYDDEELETLLITDRRIRDASNDSYVRSDVKWILDCKFDTDHPIRNDYENNLKAHIQRALRLNSDISELAILQCAINLKEEAKANV